MKQRWTRRKLGLVLDAAAACLCVVAVVMIRTNRPPWQYLTMLAITALVFFTALLLLATSKTNTRTPHNPEAPHRDTARP